MVERVVPMGSDGQKERGGFENPPLSSGECSFLIHKFVYIKLSIVLPKSNLADCSKVDGGRCDSECLEHTTHSWNANTVAFLQS